MSKPVFTREDVAKHNTAEDCWLIIDNKVLDVTKFMKFHPGGATVIAQLAGRDVTEEFYALHKEAVLRKFGKRLVVGEVIDAKTPSPLDAKVGELSMVPYAESPYMQGWKSPYFNDSHVRFRAALRDLVEKEVIPTAAMKDEMGSDPSDALYKKLGKAGVFAYRLGPGPHLKAFKILGGVKPEEFDYFHEMIAHEEFARVGYPGYVDSLGTGLIIGLPPIMLFAKKALQKKVIMPCLLGEKKICLAISEPTAGSDVAGIGCTAVKSPCGKFYIVNGIKKWITNGSFCDYFTTAVVTGGPGTGMKGISLLLIERGPGVTTKKIKTAYSASAGTCLVILENVKVPVENLIGQENRGFACIMANFNHERWFIIAGVVRQIRLAVEESFKWANQRKVFGKPLIAQPVIRAKLANMIAQMESTYNWLENITYQMTTMTYKEQTRHLAGPLALLKLQSTRVALVVADDACQILGGRAITRTGMGNLVQRFASSVKFPAILGGSEEIMAELGIKQALKYMPKHARL